MKMKLLCLRWISITAAVSTTAITLAASTAVAQSNSCTTAPPGLVSWWTGDGNANDYVGTNKGTLINGASFAAGQVSQSFSLNAGSSQYVSVPDSASLHVNQFTIDAWVNFNSLHPDHAQHVLAKSLGSGTNDSFVLWYQSGALHGGTTDINGMLVIDYAWTPDLGTWHHVAYTFDGANHSLYVDGVQVATAANTHSPIYDSHSLLIGADYPGDVNTSPIDFFDGMIDEVDLFSRALSATEVQAIYNAGSSGKCRTDYDAVRDFNMVKNETTQTWQYGYTATDGTGFTNDPPEIRIVDHDFAGETAWVAPDHGELSVVFNGTTQTVHYNAYTYQQPDEIGMFPGNNGALGAKSVVRWTAPANNTYSIAGRFRSMDIYHSDGSIVVTRQSQNPPIAIQLFSQTVSPDALQSFSLSIQLNAGDTIDFRVGLGDDGYGYDGTGLAVTITPAATVAPALTVTPTAPSTVGGPMHFAASLTGVSSAGWTVRIQSSLTPDTESSWTDLNDGNSGYMTESPAGSGNYTLDSTGYPQLNGVFFRAIAAKDGEADIKSQPSGSFNLLQGTITFSETGPTTPGGDILFQATTLSGWQVRVQSSFNGTDGWTDLPDGNGAKMTEDATHPGNYSLDTTAYPGGGTVFFRAIAAKQDQNDLISNPLELTHLNQAALGISLALSSTSDPVHGSYTLIGDDLTFTFTIRNGGSAPAKNLTVTANVPTYQENGTDLHKQFLASDIMLSPNGRYIPESSQGANDAQIVWSIPDLTASPDPNLGNLTTVSFTVHIANKVRTEEQIGLAQDAAAVFSSTNQPAGRTTGLNYVGGSSTNIQGPILMLVTPSTNTVAPGAQFTYKLQLQNLSAVKQNHAIAIMVQPDFTRYIGVSSSNGKTKAKLAYVSGQTEPEVVMDAGAILAHSSVTITLTFQAQWADPAEVRSIGTINYAGAFLSDASYATFTSDYNSADTDPYGTPGSTDFFAFFSAPANNIALASNNSGVVNITLTGSLANQPLLVLLKTVSNKATDIESDGSGEPIDTVHVGDKLTFLLGASNAGLSEADGAYIRDSLPDGATLDLTSLKVLGSTTSGRKSTPRIVLDPDGRHFIIAGLTLLPNDSMSFSYTTTVTASAGNVIEPATPTLGSVSTPHTPAGLYFNGPINVANHFAFAQPHTRFVPGSPGVSSDPAATANQLTPIYRKNPSQFPLTNSKDATSIVPGAQRLYVHYKAINAGNNIELDVPVPAHSVFYRAAFVLLPPSTQQSGSEVDQLGAFPGTVLPSSTVPANWSIVSPQQLSAGGTVAFKFGSLAAGFEGDVMVEVIVTSDVVDVAGSLTGDGSEQVVMRQTSSRSNAEASEMATNVAEASSTSAPSLKEILARCAVKHPSVPSIGLVESFPLQVKQGDTFPVQLTVYNYGDLGAYPLVVFYIPENTVFVSASCGQSFLSAEPTVGSGPGPLGSVQALLATGNGVVRQGSGPTLLGHSAAALTVTLRATGPVGAIIPTNTGWVQVDNVGRIYPPQLPSLGEGKITIVGSSPQPGWSYLNAGNALLSANASTAISGDVFLIDLGKGNIVAQGGGNIVSTGGSNIVAQGGGNIVAQGGGNFISFGPTTSGASLLASQSQIVAQRAGNFIVGQGGLIVAQGGGNIVAAGGGNIVSTGGSNIVAQGGGNIVAQGGGNIVAQGGGNIVAQGGGNYIAAGGAAIVAQGGGNLLASLPNSVAGFRSSGGSIVAQGGGNIVAQGGGN